MVNAVVHQDYLTSPLLVVSAAGGLRRGSRGMVEVHVMNAKGRAVRRARGLCHSLWRRHQPIGDLF
jgi:hypothetical protein